MECVATQANVVGKDHAEVIPQVEDCLSALILAQTDKQSAIALLLTKWAG